MTDNITYLKDSMHLPTALRNIADELEAGHYGPTDQATVIFPGASEVFHVGGRDADAGTSATLNMVCGLAKIAKGVLEG